MAGDSYADVYSDAPRTGSSAPSYSATLNLTIGPTLSLVASSNIGSGAGALTITPDVVNLPPRMLIDLTGAPGTSVTITRVDMRGNVSVVRSANPSVLTAGEFVGYDYEAPFGQPVTYVATPNAGSPITSAAVTLDIEQPWLIHPGIPGLSQPLIVASVGDQTRATNQGVHVILGRADPIVITDGVRQLPTFDLTVRTETLVDEENLATLLDDSSVLLLQVVYPGIQRNLYQWVSVGQVTSSDVVPWFGNTITAWTLPCTSTGVPIGLLQSQFTLADLAAQYATLGDIRNNYATMRDIATNNPVGT